MSYPKAPAKYVGLTHDLTVAITSKQLNGIREKASNLVSILKDWLLDSAKIA